MGATATVKGGFWPEVGVASLTQVQGTGPGRRRIAQQLSDKGLRTLREKAVTLNGAAAGSTAAATQGRIEANSELGGKRTIETETFVNTATVSGDITEINNDLLNPLTSKTTMASPANKDGNPLGTR